MADRTVDQLKTRLDGAFADILDRLGVAHALDVRVRAEFEVDPVDVVNIILLLCLAHKIRKITADIRA